MSKRTIAGISKSQKATLPKALWMNIGEFLTKNELGNLFISRYFALVALNCLVQFYKQKYTYFPLLFSTKHEFSLDLLKTLNIERQLYDSRYYTVFNRRFIELFCLVEEGKSAEAKTFVEAELKSFLAGEKNYNEYNILDFLFCFDKNAIGETVINIAARKGLKDFLNYCFNRLISNDEVKPGLLVKPGRFNQILSELNSKKMSTEALWLFACAYVCEQKDVCDILSKTPGWQKTWVDDSPKQGESLTWMATCLGSFSLVKLGLEGLSAEEMNSQLFLTKIYYSDQFDFLEQPMKVECLKMAAVCKNSQMVYYFLSVFDYEFDGGSELAIFFIEQQDLSNLNRFYFDSNELEYLNYSSFYPALNLPDSMCSPTPRTHAIALNWQRGIQALTTRVVMGLERDMGDRIHPLNAAIEFGRIGLAKYLLEQKIDPNGYEKVDEESPIFQAIRKNSLNFVKLLVEHKASLDIENKAEKVPQYPLIGAALNQNSTMVQYLLQSGKLDRLTAVRQLRSTVSFFTKRSRLEQRILAKVYSYVNLFAMKK